MTTPAPVADVLDMLTREMLVVRPADTALDLEPRASGLHVLAGLGVVHARVRGGTTLGLAEAIMSVVREAAAKRLNPRRPEHLHAQLLFRVHPDTERLDPVKAREHARVARGLTARQFRAREEPRLCRLVAQAILELQAEHDEVAVAVPLKFGAQPSEPNTAALADRDDQSRE